MRVGNVDLKGLLKACSKPELKNAVMRVKSDLPRALPPRPPYRVPAARDLRGQSSHECGRLARRAGPGARRLRSSLCALVGSVLYSRWEPGRCPDDVRMMWLTSWAIGGMYRQCTVKLRRVFFVRLCESQSPV